MRYANSTFVVLQTCSKLVRRNRFKLPLLGIAALPFLATTSANAALTLSWVETAGPRAGASGSDTDITNNVASNFMPFGDFSTSIDVGTSNENTGTTQAILQINSIDSVFVPSGPFSGPVVLQLTLTQDGFTFPGASGNTLNLTSAINSSTFANSSSSDNVTFLSTAFDTSDTATTPLETSTSPGGSSLVPGSGAPAQTVPFLRTATSYTLENVLTLTFSTSGEEENVGGTTATVLGTPSVPEPASLGTLALGGLMLMRRRRAAK